MNFRQTKFVLLFAAIPGLGWAQSVADSAEVPPAPVVSNAVIAAPAPGTPVYVRPNATVRFHDYLYDSFGPYPAIMAAATAGINQWTDSPPDWQQGFKGYSERFGSNLGITMVSNTTQYALSEAFKQDSLYYPCTCRGFFPRLRHAVLSTVIARGGDDGHSVFAFPALVAPYAGTTAAIYGWYPNRFDAEDAFRMGNYRLLGYIGSNLSIEFLPSTGHALMTRLHLNNRHAAANSDAGK